MSVPQFCQALTSHRDCAQRVTSGRWDAAFAVNSELAKPRHLAFPAFYVDDVRVTLAAYPRLRRRLPREPSMMGRRGQIGAVATYLKRPALRAAAIACIGWGFVIGPNDGAAAEKLRVGVNLTTIERGPIFLAADGLDVELTGGAIPSLTDGKVDVVTNAETQAILRSTARPDIRVILTVAEYGYRIVARG